MLWSQFKHDGRVKVMWHSVNRDKDYTCGKKNKTLNKMLLYSWNNAHTGIMTIPDIYLYIYLFIYLFIY